VGGELFKNREDVVRGQNLVFLVVNFDFRAAVFADEHAVALLDFKRNFLSVVVGFAGAEGDDDAFLRLFLGGIGNDDAALFSAIVCLFVYCWFLTVIKSHRIRDEKIHSFFRNSARFWTAKALCHFPAAA
jgi:hypothetical protein